MWSLRCWIVCVFILEFASSDSGNENVSESSQEKTSVDDTFDDSYDGNFNHENILGSGEGQGNRLAAFGQLQDSCVKSDCILVVSSDCIHSELVHFDDRPSVGYGLCSPTIKVVEIPVNYVSNCELDFRFCVAFDCLHCVLDHERILGSESGQGNLRGPPLSQ